MGRPIKKPPQLGVSRFRALEILTTSLLVPSGNSAGDYASKTGLMVAQRTIAWLLKKEMVEYVNAQGIARITPAGRKALVQVARADAFERNAARDRALAFAREQILFRKREEDRQRKLNATWLRRMNKRHKKVEKIDDDLA